MESLGDAGGSPAMQWGGPLGLQRASHRRCITRRPAPAERPPLSHPQIWGCRWAPPTHHGRHPTPAGPGPDGASAR